MHIRVSEILAQDEGFRTSFEISGETPVLEDVELADEISGQVAATRLKEGLLINGRLETQIMLECHRCLRAFSYPAHISLAAEFRLPEEIRGADDIWPIERGHVIDLAPAIRQELIVATPIKQLCQADCPGICLECGKLLDEHHENHSN